MEKLFNFFIRGIDNRSYMRYICNRSYMDLNIRQVDRDSVKTLKKVALEMGVSLRDLCIQRLGIKPEGVSEVNDGDHEEKQSSGGVNAGRRDQRRGSTSGPLVRMSSKPLPEVGGPRVEQGPSRLIVSAPADNGVAESLEISDDDIPDDLEPEVEMCAYKEYDTESGETYRCGLQRHSPKIKHTRGERV